MSEQYQNPLILMKQIQALVKGRLLKHFKI